MAMGTRKRSIQPHLVCSADLPAGTASASFERLELLLQDIDFDRQAERASRPFYTSALGRPSLPPSVYFRLLLLGYLIGVDSERDLALYARDSLSVRRFLGYAPHEPGPDPSTLARARRRIAPGVQQRVLARALRQIREAGLDQSLAVRVRRSLPGAARLQQRNARRKYGRFVAGLAQQGRPELAALRKQPAAAGAPGDAERTRLAA